MARTLIRGMGFIEEGIAGLIRVSNLEWGRRGDHT